MDDKQFSILLQINVLNVTRVKGPITCWLTFAGGVSRLRCGMWFLARLPLRLRSMIEQTWNYPHRMRTKNSTVFLEGWCEVNPWRGVFSKWPCHYWWDFCITGTDSLQLQEWIIYSYGKSEQRRVQIKQVWMRKPNIENRRSFRDFSTVIWASTIFLWQYIVK